MSVEARNWRPVADWSVLDTRARLLAAARAWFSARRITEVDTPMLTRSGVTDSNIESIRATLTATPGKSWYLHTSPEYAMKRLLAAGAPDIYQICHVFRDGEHGRHHQPEFTMVEWYRHGFDLTAMIADTLSLLRSLLEPSLGRLESATYRYRDLFREVAGLDPLTADDDALRAAVRQAGAGSLATEGDRSTCLDFLMAARIAPALAAAHRLSVLTHYPASQAALATLDPDDPGVALRFEVFLDGRELANGFVELRDAAEQRRRFEEDRRTRRERGAADMLPDEALLAALEHGLPETAGVAIGFDRVVMAATGQADIRSVQSFPVMDGESPVQHRPTDTPVEETLAAIASLIAAEKDPLANAANFVAALREGMDRVNWLGLYVLRGEELVLGPFQGRPACVRIPLGRGVCGTAATRRETVSVPDVHEFEGHIACDPASRSEVVVPLTCGGKLWGVLDVDSPEPDRFTDADVCLLEAAADLLCRQLGERAFSL